MAWRFAQKGRLLGAARLGCGAAVVSRFVGLLAVALLCALEADAALAQATPTTLYDDAALTYWRDRYARSTPQILEEVLLPKLSDEQRARLRDLRLTFPLRGEDLFDFAAVATPPEIALPGSSLKLLDDLSTAYAWLWVHEHDRETIGEYIAMLRYKPVGDFPRGRYPAPFEALGIPKDALEDPAIDRLALRLFNSARTFLLAREVSHVLLRDGVPTQAEAIAADEMALDLVARSGTIPMGLIVSLQVAAVWSPTPAPFAGDAAWQTVLRDTKSYPMTAERIAATVAALERQAPVFARSDPDAPAALQALRFIADSLVPYEEYLRDEALQRCVAERARLAPPKSLAPRPPESRLFGCAD